MKKIQMNKKPFLQGFTIIELLIAMSVTGIVLAAAATLAYAMSTAYDSGSDISMKQSVVRYASLRLSNIIRNSRLVCASSPEYVVLWLTDNNRDNKINVSEIAYLETTKSKNSLRLLQFSPAHTADDAVLSLKALRTNTTKSQLTAKYPALTTMLIPDCENIQIHLNVAPPDTTFINIIFNIRQDRELRTYEIGTALRCRAGNLIDGSDEIVPLDDD
jgi:prepilin-type N-terminal cleavage/methylation domain-containing protein